MNKIFFIKIAIIIICIYSNNVNLSYIYKFISYIKRNDFKNFEIFVKFCNEKIEMNKKFKKMKNPKVSVISPIHNREKYLIRFLTNIQHQNFYDITFNGTLVALFIS